MTKIEEFSFSFSFICGEDGDIIDGSEECTDIFAAGGVKATAKSGSSGRCEDIGSLSVMLWLSPSKLIFTI